ncbi:MAG: hypothetical protein ACLP5E_05395 [Streptosporangiaceae bacterium]
MTLTWDKEVGQVTLEGLPEGPAGGASLSPAEGVELIFDCAGGQLARVFVAAGEAGSPPVIGEPAATTLKRLFGSRVCSAIRQAARRDGDPLAVWGEPGTLAAMSRLARLDAARLTSSMPESPLWSVEAAQLAARAGLGARVTAEARRAASELASAADVSPLVLAAAADTVAGLVAAAEPGLASQLQDAVVVARSVEPASVSRKHAKPPALPDIAAEDGLGADIGQLHWSLDPRLIPAGLFQHTLWPDAELTVRPGRSRLDVGARLDVEARLAPGADRRALATCRARLVDPADRRVLGVASFRDLGGSLVRAEIRKRRPSREAWVEIVADAGRPVFSSKLHHIRRAMRWADAALGAGRQRFGLADAGWTWLAATAWGRCAAEWAAAGDHDRAYLAAARQAGVCPGVSTTAEPPSGWAKELASRPPLVEEPFLAEKVTE